MDKQFLKALEAIGITLTKHQEQQFKLYYELLIEWNQKMNLTAITKEAEVYEKHFYDSILLSQCIALKDQSLCDIGAGAGFPSIPLKIVFP
ncbi:MAG: 16S rRNA (guanine(527)-N(7))-methyltransferase RsmG, partial [Bacilli bacterium]